MIDCDALIARLFTYLDGEVSVEECAEIQAHLAECGGCADHAGFESAVIELIRTKCCEQVPVGFLDRLRAALDEH